MDIGRIDNGITADSADFYLAAGRYAVPADLNDATALALELKVGIAYFALPSEQTTDGNTVPVSFAADGVLTAWLPGGTYRWNVTYTSGVGASGVVSRIQ